MDARDLLSRAKEAAPCQARWEDMKGDDQCRFCRYCHKYIYDFSTMTAEELVDLLRMREGRLSTRFYQRKDGRMLTQDCPVGAVRFGQSFKKITGVTVAAVVAVSGTLFAANRAQSSSGRAAQTQLASDFKSVVADVKDWLGLTPPPQPQAPLVINTTPRMPGAPRPSIHLIPRQPEPNPPQVAPGVGFYARYSDFTDSIP